ncbi:CmcJ/NvfI family oxidoreductase [Sphingomonas sp. AOB5]|uniref:CmcJ/NvfI family oxidoreductase n=1 Tax=Sphingomonas sp. AOB5 TaxID=3034017 RepID=UPI0023F80808|nr:CmcJ/NvfI family oxidoreductase [Sphingomonas sp. AOB5]MDF7774867.1 CmcJ/NvfI family oxidoreductase [Sphingomonas sp. AOB5]
MPESHLLEPGPQLSAEDAFRRERPAIDGTINYLHPTTERPWSAMTDLSNRNFTVDATPVRIENGWPIASGLSLDREGFVVVRHETRVGDFRDSDQLTGAYAREIEALIIGLTGADRAIVVEKPLTRFSGEAGSIQPGLSAHMDFTYDTVGERMAERGIDLTLPEFQRYRRICIYQTWRALSGPGQDTNLAFADGSTVAEQDLVESISDRYQENSKPGFNTFYLCTANPAHRWYYFPRLRRDDLLVWKGIDLTDRSVRPVHTAILDPFETDAPPRNSVETRVYTFFE